PKAQAYYTKEGINKLAECAYCCRTFRKRQGYQLWNTGTYLCTLEEKIAYMVLGELRDRPTYTRWNRIYHRTRYGVDADKTINETKIN
ncbi:14293_t:CDS:1, partial [Ambispora leptoticha]